MAQVSLLVLNYNGKKFLETLLPSIQRQTFRDFETILVDNGSSDDSIEYVQKNFPEIRILKIKPNIGFSRAVNYGFQRVSGKHVILVSNDNRLDERCVERLVDAVVRDPTGLYSTRNMDFYHPGVIDDVGGTNNVLGYPIALRHGESMRKEYEGTREVFALCGNVFIMSRELFLTIGGLDEQHFAYLEDSDLGWRARLYGHRSYCVGDAVSYHMLSGTWGRDSEGKRYLIERNRTFMVMKNFSAGTLVKLTPLLVVFDLVKFVFFLVTGNVSECRVILRAQWWIFRNLKTILRQRKNIQRRRVVGDQAIIPFLEARFAGSSFLGTKHKAIVRALNVFLSVYCRMVLGRRTQRETASST